MLMGVERLESITRQMISHGVRPDLPVALQSVGPLPVPKKLSVGTLENIGQRALEDWI